MKLNETFLLNRVKNALFSSRGNLISKGLGFFPLQINGFKFVKTIYVDKKVKMYEYAEYQNKKKEKAFAKVWFGQRKNNAYYWLKNETNIFSSARAANGNNRNLSFSLPKLYGIYENENTLILLVEKIPNYKDEFPERVLINIYNNALQFIRVFGSKINNNARAKILNITPKLLLLSLPLLTVKSIKNRPDLWREILASSYFFLRNVRCLFNSRWDCLVHRDLRGSILLAQGHYYIIDWQTVAFSSPLLELAQLLMTYWENDRLGFDVFRIDYAKKLLTSDLDLNCLNLLCIYLAFVEISLINIKTRSEEKTFLHYILDRRSSKQVNK